jgi:hypothetical protein
MPERPQSLKKLRSWRVYPDRDVTIAKQVRSIVRDASAKQRHTGGATAAWEAAAPAQLRDLCNVRGAASGILTIKVKTAAARFQIDRWLRAGGEAALRSGGVKRVKLI